MKKHFDVDAYLRDAEARFSSASGEEWFEGSEFEGEESHFSSNTNLDLGFEGDSYAAGAPMAALKQPSPYQVIITNSTPAVLLATLFGMNQYLLTPNFGSAAGLTVQNAVPNVTYLELLQQSASQPFETSLLRIQSSNTSQITQTITITSKDANGQQAIIPLITQNYFSANQFQSGILDIPFAIKIDGNTNLQFPVLNATTVFMTFFPAEKSNLSRQLNGQNALQTYAAPSIPIAAMPLYVSPNAFARQGHRHLSAKSHSAPQRRVAGH
jgi:hypothetical protein